MSKEKIKFGQANDVIIINPNLITLLFQKDQPSDIGIPRDVFSLSGNDCYELIKTAIYRSNEISLHDNTCLDLSYLKKLPHIIRGNIDEKGYNHNYPHVQNNTFNINSITTYAVELNFRACAFTINDDIATNSSILHKFFAEFMHTHPVIDDTTTIDQFFINEFYGFFPTTLQEFFNEYTPLIYTEQSLQLQILEDFIRYPNLMLKIANILGDNITEVAAIKVCKKCLADYFYDAVKNNYLSSNTVEKIIDEFPELIYYLTDNHDYSPEFLKSLKTKALTSNYKCKPENFDLDYNDETVSLIFE